jgi:hypothetical protein
VWLLNKNTEKYFPSLDGSSLNWARDPFVLSAFESAELTVAEDDEPREMLTDGKLKRKQSSNRCGLILVVCPTGVLHRHKTGD